MIRNHHLFRQYQSILEFRFRHQLFPTMNAKKKSQSTHLFKNEEVVADFPDCPCILEWPAREPPTAAFSKFRHFFSIKSPGRSRKVCPCSAGVDSFAVASSRSLGSTFLCILVVSGNLLYLYFQCCSFVFRDLLAPRFGYFS